MSDSLSSPRYKALIQLLRSADAIWESSRIFFARWNLSPSQFNVLNLLRGSERGLSQAELSRELLMHRSNATGLIDRLEERGLVCRLAQPGDRRVNRLVLTSAGQKVLQEVLPLYHQGADEIWGETRAGELKQLTSILHDVAARAQVVASGRRKEQSVYDHRTVPERRASGGSGTAIPPALRGRGTL